MYMALRRQFKEWLRYACVGAAACLLAGVASEILIQALHLETRSGDPNDPLAIAMLIDTSSEEESAGIAEARKEAKDSWAHLDYNLETFHYSGSGLGDDIADALQEASKFFIDRGSTRNAVFLFSNNAPNSGFEQLLSLVSTLRQNGVFFVTVGTENSSQDLMRILASESKKTFFSAQSGNLNRAFKNAARVINSSTVGSARVSRGLVVSFLVILLLIGGLQVADNLWGLRGHWWRDLWWVPLSGAVLGIGLGTLSQSLVPYWTLVGFASGAALGVPNMVGSLAWRGVIGASRKTWRGALFGLLGGLTGATLVRLNLMLVDQIPIEADWMVPVFRTTSLVVLGLGVGFFYKLGEDWLRDAWLLGTAEGDNKSRRQVLEKPKVTVGRSGENDICLYRSEQVADYAGCFIQHGKKWLFQPAKIHADRFITIDGRMVRNLTLLPDKSLLRLGNSSFVFRQRRMAHLFDPRFRWVLVGDKQEYTLPRRRRNKLGSASGCDIVVQEQGIAGHHCTLEFTPNGLCVQPNDSMIVAVNDRETGKSQRRALQQGDLLTIGSSDLAVVWKRCVFFKKKELSRLFNIRRLAN